MSTITKVLIVEPQQYISVLIYFILFYFVIFFEIGTLPVAAVDVETPSGNQYDRVEGSLLPSTTLDTAPAPFPYTLRNNTSGPPALPARRPPQPPSRKPANNSETYGKVPTEPVAPLYDTVADVQTHGKSCCLLLLLLF